MSHFNKNDPDGLIRGEINLDIVTFVRTAVRKKMDRDTIMVYLHIVSQTPGAPDKMRWFADVAQELDLTRNEILVGMYLSCRGPEKTANVIRKLRIPPRFVENALTVLEEKGIIKSS